MAEKDPETTIREFILKYVETVRAELAERWKCWPIDLTKNEMHEIIGALLGRQVTLATQLALSPSIWNGHTAPLFLRSMVDGFITLAWIFVDPVDRSRKFIRYGLGQEKLDIEHRRKLMEEAGKNPDDDPLIKHKEGWVNSQRFTFLTEVNVGSWSGIDIRAMAEDAGYRDLYRYAYVPFSAATHNMWHHVSRYNLTKCPNPLHAYHKVPIDPFLPPDIDYLYRAAKYVEKALKLFDEKTGVKISLPSAFEMLVQFLESLGKEADDRSQLGQDISKEGSDK